MHQTEKEPREKKTENSSRKSKVEEVSRGEGKERKMKKGKIDPENSMIAADNPATITA